MIPLTFLIVSIYLILVSQCNLIQATSLQSDVHATPCQLIQSRNFICDEHFVTTKDGYILSIQRIVNPVLNSSYTRTHRPVVLQHGLFGASTHWLINSDGGFASDWTGHAANRTTIKDTLITEGRNLPYLLANLGYDVWLPNSRGNTFSRNHTYLNPDSGSEFWAFSFDEMVSFDTPTVIDYILQQTGHQSLSWIGHSQGSLVIFGLLSERPEYSSKIEPFIALAPITILGHTSSPMRHLASIPLLKRFVTFIGGELVFPSTFINIMADSVCPSIGGREICNTIYNLFNGYDSGLINTTRLSIYLSQGLHGTSWQNLVHYGQAIRSNSFTKFDYGFISNLYHYYSWRPGKYNLGAIDLKSIILIDSKADPLADPLDVKSLKESLKVPFTELVVPDPKFAHLDFLWAKDIYQQVHEPLIDHLRRYN